VSIGDLLKLLLQIFGYVFKVFASSKIVLRGFVYSSGTGVFLYEVFYAVETTSSSVV